MAHHNTLLTPQSFYRYWGFMYLYTTDDSSQRGLIERAIKLGADVNIKDHDDKSPLWWACYNGDLPSVDLLRNVGARW